MGTMIEAGAPLLMSVRLRIELGRITEIESIYFKPGGGGPNNIAGDGQDAASPTSCGSGRFRRRSACRVRR